MKNLDIKKIRKKCIDILLAEIGNNNFYLYTKLENGKIVESSKKDNILLYYTYNNLNTIIFIDNENIIIELKLLVDKFGQETPLLFLEQNTTDNTIFLILRYKEKEIFKISDIELEKNYNVKRLQDLFNKIKEI